MKCVFCCFEFCDVLDEFIGLNMDIGVINDSYFWFFYVNFVVIGFNDVVFEFYDFFGFVQLLCGVVIMIVVIWMNLLKVGVY